MILINKCFFFFLNYKIIKILLNDNKYELTAFCSLRYFFIEEDICTRALFICRVACWIYRTIIIFVPSLLMVALAIVMSRIYGAHVMDNSVQLI